MTDASAYCIGGVIGHMVGKEFKPIAYGSKILSETEQRYPSFKREFLALKHFVSHWRYYLINKKFTVYVDMKAITYENFMKKTNCAVIMKWILELADYNFDIIYKKGALMGLPDLLLQHSLQLHDHSRYPSHKPYFTDSPKKMADRRR